MVQEVLAFLIPRWFFTDPHPLIEPLSEREFEVLCLIADGLSNQKIADTLFIIVGTVKTHIKHIYRKLDVDSRTQAIVRGRRSWIVIKVLDPHPQLLPLL